MSKTFSEKILRKSTKISMSLFPRLFVFYRVFRCFLAMGVHRHYKKRFTKKSCRKVFTKKSTKQSQTDCFSIFFYHVFGRFSVRGDQKHDKKISQKKSDQPWYCFGLRGTNQPRRGPSLFFLSAPCAICVMAELPKRRPPPPISEVDCCTAVRYMLKQRFRHLNMPAYCREQQRGGTRLKKKHDEKSRKKSDQPWHFFGRQGTNQQRRGPSLFFLSAPWDFARLPVEGTLEGIGTAWCEELRVVLRIGCPLSCRCTWQHQLAIELHGIALRMARCPFIKQ
jgi:hypothetical protein